MANGPEHRRTEAAIQWVLRCERGLTAAEQDEFSEWLAADPQHGLALAQYRGWWQRLDRLACWRPEHGERPNPDLLAPPKRRAVPRWLVATLALAAGVAVTFWVAPPRRSHARASVAASLTLPAQSAPRILPDGTTVELNGDAILSVHFTPAERRVRLERGEAHFKVTKNPARPFVVSAEGIEVRAVGTAFNVRLEHDAVEVLVTEGKVRLDEERKTGTTAPARAMTTLVPVLEARQRAVVPTAAHAGPPQIATLTPAEIQRVLAWQHRMLDFTAAPLSAIVAEFNRHNTVQMVVVDPELASTRITAQFRSDNLEGFLRLLEAGFDVTAERRGDAEIVLRRRP